MDVPLPMRKLILSLVHVQSWPLAVRFLLIGALFVISVAIPSYLLGREMMRSIDFAEKEHAGLSPVQFQLAIIQKTQQHRGLAGWFLNDPFADNKDLRAKGEDVEGAIVRFEKYGKNFKNTPLVSMLEAQTNEWHSISQSIAPRAITASESFGKHTQLVARQLYGLDVILAEYQLILDPEKSSYFLISSGLVELPRYLEFLAQLRGLGTELLAKQEISEGDRQKLMSLLYAAKWQLHEYQESINQVTGVESEKRAHLIQQYTNLVEQSGKLFQLVNDRLITGSNITLSPAEYYSSFTLGVNTGYSLSQLTLNEIDISLTKRIEQQKTNMVRLISLVGGIALIVLVLSTVFVVRLLAWLGGEPNYAMRVVSGISDGNFEQSIFVKDQDSLLGAMQTMQKKLQEHDRLKSEFISTISHELRTPITAINGALALIDKKHGDTLTADMKLLLNMANRNGERLKELIQDLLDFEQVSNAELVLETSPSNLVELLRELESQSQVMAQRNGISINFSYISEEIIAKVHARRFQQIIQSFISNAIKFSQKGNGVDVFLSVNNGSCRVEVTDHGCGIPPEFYNRIFTKFSQADSSDSRKVGGAGLGLALAKSLAESMGGKVDFRSELNVGSSFYLILPEYINDAR